MNWQIFWWTILIVVVGVIITALAFVQRGKNKAILSTFGTRTLPFPYYVSEYRQGFCVVFKLAEAKTSVALLLRQGINKNAIYDWCEVGYFPKYRMDRGANVALLEKDWEALNDFIKTTPAQIVNSGDAQILKEHFDELFGKIDNFQRINGLKKTKYGIKDKAKAAK